MKQKTTCLAQAAAIVLVAVAATGCTAKWHASCTIDNSGPSCTAGVEGTFRLPGDGETVNEVVARNHAKQKIEDAIRRYGSPFVIEQPDWSSLTVSVDEDEISYSIDGGAVGPRWALESSFAVAASWFDVDVTWHDNRTDVEIQTYMKSLSIR